MPRLSTRLINSARRISPLVALLLRSCRDVPSARNELRWIGEHVSKTTNNFVSSSSESRYRTRLFRLCKARSRGVPLQYILGTQPFGELEIKCRPGVLIPRSETEAYTLEIGRILRDEIRHGGSSDLDNQQHQQSKTDPRSQPSVRILDVCSGTGCISLSLYAQLRHACPNLEIVGLDISPKAIKLSRENITHNNLVPQGQHQSVSYHKGDILDPSNDITKIMGLTSPVPSPNTPHQTPQFPGKDHPDVHDEGPDPERNSRKWDLIISNPPYISTTSFSRDTTRSVRNFEPKLALVPFPLVAPAAVDNNSKSCCLTSICKPEDVFYARILDLSRDLNPKRILFEVADLEQARRVVELVLSAGSHALSSSHSGNDSQEGGQEGDGGQENKLGRSLGEMYKVIEIWRDDPSSSSFGNLPDHPGEEVNSGAREDPDTTVKTVTVQGIEIPIRGSGCARSVYFFVGHGAGDV